MKLSVLVPTFRRPKDLRLVLDTLKGQTRFPDEVIVTVRDIDTETRDFFAHYDSAPLPLKIVDVSVPGVVAAMNAGIAAATGDIIVQTDDDTEPMPDWLARIEAHFVADPRVGGVGGRDYQKDQAFPEMPTVGLIQWCGRQIGNHHLGVGPARPVEVLKGANCAFRAGLLKAVGFDTRMLGKGAQVNWEMSLCFAFRKAGWTLIYDPAVLVHHHVAQRHGDDLLHRGVFNVESYMEAVHNETLCLWEYLSPARRVGFVVWAVLIGYSFAPGFAVLLREKFSRDAMQRFLPMIRARLRAIHTSRTVPAPGRSLPRPESVLPGSKPTVSTGSVV